MIFKPAQLGMAKLDKQELVEDRKSCKRIGPCGVGKKALYLNSFYIDRRYYLPYGSITRVFKRVAIILHSYTPLHHRLFSLAILIFFTVFPLK